MLPHKKHPFSVLQRQKWERLLQQNCQKRTCFIFLTHTWNRADNNPIITNYFRLREYLCSLMADHATLIARATLEELNRFDMFQQTGLTGSTNFDRLFVYFSKVAIELMTSQLNLLILISTRCENLTNKIFLRDVKFSRIKYFYEM